MASIPSDIQLELGYAESADISIEEALALYDKYVKEALELMLAKNHDYDEAWRSMRISSYTDLILMKIYRTKQIESLSGNTLVSEGIDANYMDMINYSVFGLIKIELTPAVGHRIEDCQIQCQRCHKTHQHQRQRGSHCSPDTKEQKDTD